MEDPNDQDVGAGSSAQASGRELRSGKVTGETLGARKKDVEFRETEEHLKQMEEQAKKAQRVREKLDRELRYMEETRKRLDEEIVRINRSRMDLCNILLE